MYACNNYNEIFNNIVSLFTIMCVCSMYPVFIHMFSEIDNLKSKLTKQVLVDDIIVCNKQPTKDIKSDATENNIEDTEKVAYDKLILNKELLKGLGKFRRINTRFQFSAGRGSPFLSVSESVQTL